ncbi:DEKNAAC104136 [Brettanomyces naardenensis]|uniref:DEKNAAC104137 n=1 Tax=Brettanomyces naardenensis TaxID=13370 RepID=A0A448YPR9_BRENA|nr:DEKNAAC104136 [Brettanomyces naardenensis]
MLGISVSLDLVLLALGSRLLEVQPFFGKSDQLADDETSYPSSPTLSSKILSSDIPRHASSGSLTPKEFKVSQMEDGTITKGQSLHSKITSAIDIVEIVHFHGYKIHEHVVRTRDGYLLSIHRILPKRELSMSELSGRPVVYMHHGLLTNSELFVLGDTASRCLPFRLVDLGYDVWLGNNRGNKYSRKHLVFSADENRFWDYSLDEFAMFDIPDTVNYILRVTKRDSLSYVGFSQGSAQALAALSLNPELNAKINVFVGLSPAMIPKGLNSLMCSYFVQSAPSFIYKIFGRRAILPSVIFWQKLFGQKAYEQIVDYSLIFLFNWKSKNITLSQKKIGYPHMFSPSSVKSIVHWFQIINSRRFQMFDDGGYSGSRLVYLSGASVKAHRVAPFPTRTITSPMLLIYGESDMLIDIEKTLDQLSCDVEAVGVPGYEHMDTLWAKDVETTVFERVITKLQVYNPVERKKLVESY